MIRRVVAILALLFLGAAVVRTAAVKAWATNNPDRAARLWSGHPEVLKTLAMSAIGEAARNGRPPGREAERMLAVVAVREPLAIEPLMVRAIGASAAGDSARAEHLFRLATIRQGRALPPHYFLAEQYLRSARVEDGLREVANLARLSPNGVANGAPYFAEYAKNPANWPSMRAIFRDQPRLFEPVMVALAQDPANAPVIMGLSRKSQRTADSTWLKPLLRAMVTSGRFDEARRLWADVSGLPATGGELIHDADFSDPNSPPPFNWELAQSSIGLAERVPGSGLHVIFYGSQGGMLARQLLTLDSGDYRLGIRSGGQIANPEALSWSIRCVKSSSSFAEIPMTSVGPLSAKISVPADCAAQWLELDGRTQDITGRSDISIPRIEFIKVSGNG